MDKALNRREVITGGLALTFASLPSMNALAGYLESKPELSAEILDLQKGLSKGGRYYRALQEPVVDTAILKQLVPRLAKVSTELRFRHFNPETVTKDEKKFIASKEVPGLVTGRIRTGIYNKLPDGRRVEGARSCNFFMLHVLGTTYISTADHCVSGTPAEAGFHTNPAIADFAVRRIDGTYTGSALTLDYHTSNDLISGLLGVTIGTKDGMRDAFYGPLVAMTDSMWHSFTDGMDVSDQFRDQVRRGFWKILPPEQGDIVRQTKTVTEVRASGRSGSIEIAYDPARYGHVIAGNFIAVGRFISGPFAGHTVGFYSGPDAMLSLVEEERGDKPRTKIETDVRTKQKESWTDRLWQN